MKIIRLYALSILVFSKIKSRQITSSCRNDTFIVEIPYDHEETAKLLYLEAGTCTEENYGGVIYAIECDKGYVLENTNTNYEKMRCVCKEGKICRKSNNFGQNFGRCVLGEESDGGGKENDDGIESEDEDDGIVIKGDKNLLLDLNLSLEIKLSNKL